MIGILSHLVRIYGEEQGQASFDRLNLLFENYRPQVPAPRSKGLSQRDAFLITYGDQVQEPGVKPLQSLAEFCNFHLAGCVSSIHLLPFYPYSSDDGFSVIDYRQVNPLLGSWEDIVQLGRSFRLMFDGVINHISAKSSWFQGFLDGKPKFQDYFIAVEGQPDLSKVVRPRALPLLTPFSSKDGQKSIWTTFSEDQIDLNYHNPDVLLEILDILLFYIAHGAEFIRLDAIAYLWKEIGTSCIHLPQTHWIIQVIRAILDKLTPHVMLITETNVPHSDNLSYFGNGYNEAQLVYNFAMPPLVLHTLQTGNARALTCWAEGLSLPSSQVTFFNFLASHDGIGLNPARGILGEAEIDALVERTKERGGLVSFKRNSDGSQSPYELNINYMDALSNPALDEPVDIVVDRFIAAHALMLSFIGVPGIYFHSLFGSKGWPEGVQVTGRNRTINRQKCSRFELDRDLAEPASLRSMVFQRMKHLLEVRAAHPGFHPQAEQKVIDCGPSVFALLRRSDEYGEKILYLQNVTQRPQRVELAIGDILTSSSSFWNELISGSVLDLSQNQAVRLAPYQAAWLAA